MARGKTTAHLVPSEALRARERGKSRPRRELDELLVGLALSPLSDGEGVCSVQFFENGNGWVGVAEALRERCPPRRARAYVEGLQDEPQAERALLRALKGLCDELATSGADAQSKQHASLFGEVLDT